MNQFSRLELMTLEIVKAIVTKVGPDYFQPDQLIDRAENIAIALYNRFEENNSDDDEYVS